MVGKDGFVGQKVWQICNRESSPKAVFNSYSHSRILSNSLKPFGGLPDDVSRCWRSAFGEGASLTWQLAILNGGHSGNLVKTANGEL